MKCNYIIFFIIKIMVLKINLKFINYNYNENKKRI